MSRPKNTIGSPPAQHPMVTAAQDFSPYALLEGKIHLFSVNPGLPAEEAVSAAYSLLDAAEFLCADAIVSEATHSHLSAIRLLVQAGQALVGSVMGAVEEANQ